MDGVSLDEGSTVLESRDQSGLGGDSVVLLPTETPKEGVSVET